MFQEFKDCPVFNYAVDVLSGNEVAGPYVKLACQRHIDDLQREDIYFDTEARDKIYRWFEKILKLSSGMFEGKPFNLLYWQKFVLGSIFGWKRKDTGFRRFTTAYIEIAKGSGKSPLVAGVGLYMICAEKEPRAEGYVLARSAEQARVTFDEMVNLIEQDDVLMKMFTIIGGNSPYLIKHNRTSSSIRKIASDSRGKGKSGPKPNIIICDEYHEHDKPDMYITMTMGTKQRREPLSFIITNSGHSKTSPCGQEHARAVKILKKEVEDDYYFAYVCALDKGDKKQGIKPDDPWTDKSCWKKANPGLPEVPGEGYIYREMSKAKGSISARAFVERWLFCIWTDSESPWLTRAAWEAVQVKEYPQELLLNPKAYELYIGLDLSLKNDLTAGGMVWELMPQNGHERYFCDCKIWTPKDTANDRGLLDFAPYTQWGEDGTIELIPGKTMDFFHVAKWIGEMDSTYNLQGIAYDPQRMDQLEKELEEANIRTTRFIGGEGLLLCPHPQGFKAGTERHSIKAPKKKDDKYPLYMPRSIDAIETNILRESCEILENKCLEWATMGAVVVNDGSSNRRLMKDKSESRIDPLVALTMAFGFAEAVGKKRKEAELSDFVV